MSTVFKDLFARQSIAAGTISGMSLIELRGANSGISTSAETVWGPGATYARLAAAVAFEVLSSSANDAAAGTGARTIAVDLIDGNYVASTVTVTLNGVTPVAITGTFLAVNGIRVLTAGSGLTNAGTIDVRTVSGSVIKGQITSNATAIGQSSDFLYTIPAGYSGFLSDVNFSGTTITGSLTVYLNSHTSTGILKTEGVGKSSLYVTSFNAGIGKISFGSGLYLPEKTLIELRTIVTAGVGDLAASAELLLVRNGVGLSRIDL